MFKNLFKPKKAKKLDSRRVQSAENRSLRRGSYCQYEPPSQGSVSRQLSIPSAAQLLGLFGFQRSPRKIEVFVRHCNYSSVSAHKARFADFSKERCLHNLLATLENQSGINLTFFLDTFHPMMQGEHFLKTHYRFPVIELKGGSECASFLHMLEYVYKQNFSDDTILYFLEDDYLHLPQWPQVLREAFTLPDIDYVTLYDHKDKYFFPQYDSLRSKILHTASCHWRTTPSTTNTYAMLSKTLKKHIDIHRCYSLGRTITADHEKFCKLAEEGAVLISSIPGFSTHSEPDYASPCRDWEKIPF